MLQLLRTVYHSALRRDKILFRSRAFRSDQLSEELVLHSTNVLKKGGIKMGIKILKEVNGEMMVVETIPTTFSKITKRNSKERNMMKISTDKIIVILFPDMQEGLYNALIKFGAVTNYQLFGFIVNARVVNTNLLNDGISIVFHTTIPKDEIDVPITFMINWTHFENFYLAHSEQAKRTISSKTKKETLCLLNQTVQ